MLMNIVGGGHDVSPWTDTSLFNVAKNATSNRDDRAQSFDVSNLIQWEIVFGHAQEKGINLHSIEIGFYVADKANGALLPEDRFWSGD